ncbi:MAG: YlxR family protein, partial [Candidatus Dormibacteraceae bacterium]
MINSAPQRTCIGCRQIANKSELIRLCRAKSGQVVIDWAREGQGRGAYLHSDPACWELARRQRSAARSLRTRVEEAVWL